jgi:hypothetical protein
MSDQPWTVGPDAPLNEGDKETAVGPGNIADRRAAEHETAQDATRTGDEPDRLAYDPDEDRRAAAEQGGQPNLDAAPTVSGRPTAFSPGDRAENV